MSYGNLHIYIVYISSVILSTLSLMFVYPCIKHFMSLYFYNQYFKLSHCVLEFCMEKICLILTCILLLVSKLLSCVIVVNVSMLLLRSWACCLNRPVRLLPSLLLLPGLSYWRRRWWSLSWCWDAFATRTHCECRPASFVWRFTSHAVAGAWRSLRAASLSSRIVQTSSGSASEEAHLSVPASISFRWVVPYQF